MRSYNKNAAGIRFQVLLFWYLKWHYDYIRVNVPKGEREKIKEYAQSQGVGVNKLLLTSLAEYQNHHGGSKDE